MKKLLGILVCLGLITTVFGQNEMTYDQRITFGISANAGWGWGFLSSPADAYGEEVIWDISGPGGALSVPVRIRLNNQLSLYTGIGMRYSTMEVFNQEIPPGSNSTYNFRNEITAMSFFIPVGLGVDIGKKDKLLGGLQLNTLAHFENNYIKYEDTRPEGIEPNPGQFNLSPVSFFLSYQKGFDLGYNRLEVGPQISYFLTDIGLDNTGRSIQSILIPELSIAYFFGI